MDLPNGTPPRVSKQDVGEFGPVWSPGLEVARVRHVERQARRPDHARDVAAVGGGGRDHAAHAAAALYTRSRMVAGRRPDRRRTRAAAREMQEAGAAFFGPAAADFVWIPAQPAATRT